MALYGSVWQEYGSIHKIQCVPKPEVDAMIRGFMHFNRAIYNINIMSLSNQIKGLNNNVVFLGLGAIWSCMCHMTAAA